jgi:hypothetical protein
MITIQNESMDSQNESMFLRISYTIPASLITTVHLTLTRLTLQSKPTARMIPSLK